MIDYPLDIIIPVWNSPVEVRAALASFASNSPMARLIMVNNGSERETESILHEFAEALDDRALLISSGKNIGTVAAVNLGLQRSSAPFALITNPYVRLAPGWFEPVSSLFKENVEAGAVCIRTGHGVDSEADHGSFSAMVLRTGLFRRRAFFDENMDGAVWALRDFSRRLTGCGGSTYFIMSKHLQLEKHQELGSIAKRLERENAARQVYIDRWGEPRAYLLYPGDSLPCESPDVFREILLDAARQGDRIMVAVQHKIGKQLVKQGFSAIHENIFFQVLPRFFSDRALRKAAHRLKGESPDAVIIGDGTTDGYQMKTISFPDFSASIDFRKMKYYRGGCND